MHIVHEATHARFATAGLLPAAGCTGADDAIRAHIRSKSRSPSHHRF